jgi:prophage regulatory protein
MSSEDDSKINDFDEKAAEDEQNDSIMRLPEVIRRTGRCRSGIYEDMSADRFPRSRKLGKRAIGWSRRDIQTYIRITLAGGEYRASIHQK